MHDISHEEKGLLEVVITYDSHHVDHLQVTAVRCVLSSDFLLPKALGLPTLSLEVLSKTLVRVRFVTLMTFDDKYVLSIALPLKIQYTLVYTTVFDWHV